MVAALLLEPKVLSREVTVWEKLVHLGGLYNAGKK